MRHSRVMRLAAIAIGLCTMASAELIALDNGLIRVEVDTDLFAIRYIGAPGGKNLIAPLHLPERLRKNGAAHLEPGGITFLIMTDEDMCRRPDGPAGVISKSANELVLLSPSFGVPAMKLHLVLRLHDHEPQASLRLDVQTESELSAEVAIVTRTLLAPHVVLRVPKSSVTIPTALPQGAAVSPLVDAGEFWDIDDPGSAGARGPAEAAFESSAIVIAGDATWTRSVVTAAPGKDAEPWQVQYRRDDDKRQQSLELACPSAKVDLWNQPALLEHWRLSPPGE